MVTDPMGPGFRGAERSTNNTAELTAIAAALDHILNSGSKQPVLIRFDSLYAGNMATSRGRARTNKALVHHSRKLWLRAHEHLDGRLWASHVYGHSGNKWNDRADELARRGKGAAKAAPRKRRRGDG